MSAKAIWLSRADLAGLRCTEVKHRRGADRGVDRLAPVSEGRVIAMALRLDELVQKYPAERSELERHTAATPAKPSAIRGYLEAVVGELSFGYVMGAERVQVA